MKKTGRLHKVIFIVFLGLLSIIGFLSTDMYLPAFETMREDFETVKSSIGASLSIFLGGFAIAQLFWGPFSDRYGKPTAIIYGLILFVLASVGIFFTHNILFFLALRGIQAIGVCAATVSWQALVIERYPKSQTARVFSTIMPLVALSPALAPLLGVYILKHLGWRYIFMVLIFIAVLLILYALGLKKQDHSRHKQQQTVNKAAHSYRSFFRSKHYLGNVMIYAVCSGAFFAWLTGAPFFLKELGYNEEQIGWSFVPQTIAFLIGGYGYNLLSNKIKGGALLPYLLHLTALSLGGLFGVAFFSTPTLTTLLIPFCVLALCNGATYPIVVDQALNIFPEKSGKASALQNTLQLGTCFLASSLVSLFSKNALSATVLVMLGSIVFIYLGLGWTRQKEQESRFRPVLNKD